VDVANTLIGTDTYLKGGTTMRRVYIARIFIVILIVSGCASLQPKRNVDNIDLPFVNDPEIIGTWKSVDFVETIEQFDPERRQWKDDLLLKEMIFFEDGKTFKPFWTWTKGIIIHHGDKTASQYLIKDIKGATYLFFEWKSGDYIIRQMPPSYYVLKKEEDTPLP
jgi:bla regulator protein BlaR1